MNAFSLLSLEAAASPSLITGTIKSDILTGTGDADTINGLAGNDRINGGLGADTMAGGVGNDTYTVDSLADILTELASQGTDTARASISLALAENVENLILTGAAALDGTGNALDNAITGNGAANILTGLAGEDVLSGGSGADTLIGGTGDDIYVSDGLDTIAELADEGTDTVKSSGTLTLGDNIERLILTGKSGIDGTGNALDNAITGNAGANTLAGLEGDDTLDGKGGADTMEGGAGDDTFIVNSADDDVIELADEGTDTVLAYVDVALLDANVENLELRGNAQLSATGNELDNSIKGNLKNNVLNGGAGDDTLDGWMGNDTMAGGVGDDIYYIDSGLDVVIEGAGEGTDTVFAGRTIATLWNNVENVTLRGLGSYNVTGNALNNVITGNSVANVLSGGAGNDTLDGGYGIDTLTGGAGNDTFYLRDYQSSTGLTDIVVEAAGEGTDVVYSWARAYSLAANVEDLTLMGSSNINGTGNDLGNWITGNAGINTLVGGAGNDKLNGGLGLDVLKGGTGNDYYYIQDETGSRDMPDTVVENGGEGADSVFSYIRSYTLTDDVENLQLLGDNAHDGTGNGLDNYILGNILDNRLEGGGGNDFMSGGDGNDVIVGGAGADYMDGSNDADLYVFEGIGDLQSTTASEWDKIALDPLQDDIDLSAIDANVTAAGNQAFVIDDDGTLEAGELQIYHSGSAVLGLYVDINIGDGSVYRLTVGSSTLDVWLNASHFIL